MKLIVVSIFLCLAVVSIQADSKPLVLSGTVPVRGDVEVKRDAFGKISVHQNSPDKMKITSARRGPASVITATAP